ncbi:MAG: hypothetical protein V3W34_00310 [Phycisphaerae bacterium]
METLTASVQYNDMIGDAAADRSDDPNKSIDKLPNVTGFPIALSLYSAHDGGYQSLSIYVVDGFSTIDEVLKAHPHGEIQARQIDIPNATVSDLLQLFKRFRITLRHKRLKDHTIKFDTP